MSNVTFSAALEAGLTHYGWLDGRKTGRAGQGPVPANLSASPEKEPWFTTSGIFGPLFGGSSPSAGLQGSLANRLRARMAAYGSPEYELIWKRWDMSSGEPICALRAVGHRTSGKGCTGWRSPRTEEETGGCYQNLSKIMRRIDIGHQVNLKDQARLAGWPTVTVQDAENCAGPSQFNRNSLPLNTAVVAWTGPDFSGGPAGMESSEGCQPSGWPTVRGQDSYERRNMKTKRRIVVEGGDLTLPTIVEVDAPKGLKLNPRFSLWLQGFPIAWAYCGERVTLSSRRSRLNS